MSKKESARQRALMVILVAGGFLSGTPAVYSVPNESAASERQLELFRKIAENTQVSPELRAYHLIQVAQSALLGMDEATLESQCLQDALRSSSGLVSPRERTFYSSLRYQADWLALETRSINDSKSAKKVSQSTLAEAALQQARLLLDKSDKSFARLNLYFMLSCLFQKVGNSVDSAKCLKIVDDAITGCESDFNKNANQVEGVVSILNSKSYAIIPVHISDRSKDPANKRDPSQSQIDWDVDFCDAEKLRLRALALVDKLPATSHLRRKAHRDMAIWYTLLGQHQDAQKEKNALFNLVGIYDDKILYPQSSGCGNVIWWKAETIRPVMLCGMG